MMAFAFHPQNARHGVFDGPPAFVASLIAATRDFARGGVVRWWDGFNFIF